MTTQSQQELVSMIGRIENLESDKSEVMEDIKELYQEAKGNGFDVKALRQIVRLRKIDRYEREEQQAILDTYLAAIEGVSDNE